MARVLVIEDEPTIRQVVASALREEGYQVDEARDGQAALELVGLRHPDIIILDMKMPRMDGWEFARLYREHYVNQAPIIVLTAAKDVAQRAFEVNARSYVSKPFDLDALVELVSEIAGTVDTDQS